MGKKEAYNKNQAKRFGWKPNWFIPCHNDFDEKLTLAIQVFQKESNLSADGMCGPSTYRVILSEREALQKTEALGWETNTSDVLWWNDQPIKIDWPSDKVHTFKDPGFPYPISKGLTKKSSKREIKSFVTHWDVCLNSMSCAKVLARRNVSVQFCIDNDGTIIQLHDMNDVCWHAGNSKVNHSAVGVEISNAFYTKYQSWYRKNGFGERPIKSGALAQNRKVEDFTWFYPVQIEALKALYKAMHEGCGIPLEAPDEKWAYDKNAASGKFKGFMNHFHCSTKKIDCAGLDIETLLKDLK
jgi:hypothetical protein|tara:strand:- start:56 stop:949 length:894 start_codon:yes stop_codon:yes gene_type:complete